jgi:hypothetical protein
MTKLEIKSLEQSISLLKDIKISDVYHIVIDRIQAYNRHAKNPLDEEIINSIAKDCLSEISNKLTKNIEQSISWQKTIIENEKN